MRGVVAACSSLQAPRLRKRLLLIPLLLLACVGLHLRYQAPPVVRGAGAQPPPSPASPPSPTSTPPSTPTPTPTPTLAPSSTPSPTAAADYVITQFTHAGFAPEYRSALSRAAAASGVAVPAVFSGSGGQCPPHDRAAPGGERVAVTNMSQRQPLPDSSSTGVPQLSSLARVTLGLVVVSHDSPATLLATLASWNASGLLALVDDAVAVLSAPLDEEISACLEAGFRVYTPRAAETAALRARHAPWLNAFGPASERPPFPPVRNLGGDAARPATYVGPAQAMAYLEMATDLVLFAEKDYRLDERMPAAQTLRSLLAAEAMLAANTAVVRLRRLDDPNKEALPNCCEGQCPGTFSDFSLTCAWNSHLDWLAIFCDPAGVVARSRGAVDMCLDERAAPPEAAAGEPLQAYCFSLNSSGWSNK